MMDRKGGCCLAPRYGAAWQMGDIMRKFRPIAPKPAAMAPATAAPAGNGKRKAVAAGAGRRGRKPKNKKAPPTVVASPVDKPLSSSPSSSSTSVTDSSTPPPPPATLTHVPTTVAPTAYLGPARVAGAPQALRPVASCVVTLESMTGTWDDHEAPSAAGNDAAPAFVSDRWGRVTWMNLAFNRAVSGGASDAAGVVLAAKDGAAVPAWGTCAGFTCRVRVTYACARRGSLVAPCDVWRLDAGAYLWRLDLQATLTLSLGGLL